MELVISQIIAFAMGFTLIVIGIAILINQYRIEKSK
jgi:hypothetical protein